MNFKLEQPIMGGVGAEGLFIEFTSQAEAEDHKAKIVRKLEHYVICKHNGLPSPKTLVELERDVEEAKQLKVVPV
jgi:hypothetical protein